MENTKSGMYRPSGKLQGDTKAMLDKGVSTGVTDAYGANLSGDSINRRGSMGGATKSDPAERSVPKDPTFG